MTHAREIGNPGKNAIAPMPRTALGTLALIAAFGQPLAAEPNSAPRIACCVWQWQPGQVHRLNLTHCLTTGARFYGPLSCQQVVSPSVPARPHQQLVRFSTSVRHKRLLWWSIHFRRGVWDRSFRQHCRLDRRLHPPRVWTTHDWHPNPRSRHPCLQAPPLVKWPY